MPTAAPPQCTRCHSTRGIKKYLMYCGTSCTAAVPQEALMCRNLIPFIRSLLICRLQLLFGIFLQFLKCMCSPRSCITTNGHPPPQSTWPTILIRDSSQIFLLPLLKKKPSLNGIWTRTFLLLGAHYTIRAISLYLAINFYQIHVY